MDQMIPHPEWRALTPHPVEGDQASPNEGAGFNLSFGEVCYVLYRHKWKIILFSLSGLAAAAAIYLMSPKVYRSEAKFWVKYLEEKQNLGPRTDRTEKTEVLRGEEVIGSEMQILTSVDLARKVAIKLGPELILAKMGGGTNLEAAVQVISSGTAASVSPGSGVIRVVFEHPDRSIVQLVLTNLLEEYDNRHWEIHRAIPNLEEYMRQKEDARLELNAAEKKLLDLQKQKSVFSIADAKRRIAQRIADADMLLHQAQTELATRTALQQLDPSFALTNAAVGAAPAVSISDQEERDKLTREYAGVLTELDLVRKREQSYQGEFKPGSKMTTPLAETVARLERRKKELEKKDGTLVGLATTGADNLVAEQHKAVFLPAKIKALEADLANAKKEEEALYEVEGPISQLEREKTQADTKYTYFKSHLDQYVVDSGLAASRFANIARVEAPTQAKRVVVHIFKRMAMAAGGGLGIGIGLAVLIEFIVDQNIKRPVELQRILPVPMYLAVPKRARSRWTRRLTEGSATAAVDLVGNRGQQGALTWPVAADVEERLHPYFEALRDRVLNRFETLARKPKLVGVCGCTDGNGATTAAAGLATALSEAGDLKVLLVDMGLNNGSFVPAQKAKTACTLLDALEGQKRQQGLVAPNLYLASARDSTEGHVLTSPTRFTTVVPRLNASDYDYIVFDLPPVNQISITPRLAKHMDLTLLVVEAHRATRNIVKSAGELLLEFTPNVATVLNNTQANLPKWLQRMM
jgi:Mrp family chromosome partitioning ATPase